MVSKMYPIQWLDHDLNLICESKPIFSVTQYFTNGKICLWIRSCNCRINFKIYLLFAGIYNSPLISGNEMGGILTCQQIFKKFTEDWNIPTTEG